MYEMEEALPGLVAPAQPVTRLSRRGVPPAGATHPQEPPVSRLPCVPGFPQGRCPFPTVNVFLPPPPRSRKSPRLLIRSFLIVHTVSTGRRTVIRNPQRLSTGLRTALPQITEGAPGNTGPARTPLNQTI